MISIIIPAYNEEGSLPKLISYLKNSSKQRGEIEIIVSDGGSTDKTVQKAEEEGAIVVESPLKGRAAQMNYGAKKSNGSILYFLHADSFPPVNFIEEIKTSMKMGFSSGCFTLAFDDSHPILNFYSWFTKFDIDYFRFGDQSLFIKKELFEKLNGFDEKLIVMEDQMFVRKIKSETNFDIIKTNIITSARKYKQVGIIKLQLVFSLILVLFYLGVSQESLFRLYRRTIG